MINKKTMITIIPELGDVSIRRTPDGRCSVYDLIAVVGNQKKPTTVWTRLKQGYPEVATKCSYFKFSGRGQREMPVIDREGWAYILGLLPGVMGKKYREEAANLVVRYLDADITLADEVVSHNDNPQDLEWIEFRVRSKVARKQVAKDLCSRGVKNNSKKDRGYAKCTNSTYRGLFGAPARQLKQQRGIDPKGSLRDDFSIDELNKTAFAEDLIGKRVIAAQAWGNDECATHCYDVAKRVTEFANDVVNG